jgi:hypothetical protein
VIHLGDGRWRDEDARVCRYDRGRTPTRLAASLANDSRLQVTRVSLATAHLNYDRGDNRPRNLRARRRPHHMLHDREERLRRRWFTHRKRNALGDLFLKPYPTPWWAAGAREYSVLPSGRRPAMLV